MTWTTSGYVSCLNTKGKTVEKKTQACTPLGSESGAQRVHAESELAANDASPGARHDGHCILGNSIPAVLRRNRRAGRRAPQESEPRSWLSANLESTSQAAFRRDDVAGIRSGDGHGVVAISHEEPPRFNQHDKLCRSIISSKRGSGISTSGEHSTPVSGFDPICVTGLSGTKYAHPTSLKAAPLPKRPNFPKARPDSLPSPCA